RSPGIAVSTFLTRHEVTASGRGPKELRAIQRASSVNRAVLGIGNIRGGEAVAKRRGGAGVSLTSTPPTGATSRNRPPPGAFLIPRPLAVVGDYGDSPWTPPELWINRSACEVPPPSEWKPRPPPR